MCIMPDWRLAFVRPLRRSGPGWLSEPAGPAAAPPASPTPSRLGVRDCERCWTLHLLAAFAGRTSSINRSFPGLRVDEFDALQRTFHRTHSIASQNAQSFVGLERAPRLARTGRARKLASSTSNLVRGAIVYNSHRLDLTGLPCGIPRGALPRPKDVLPCAGKAPPSVRAAGPRASQRNCA